MTGDHEGRFSDLLMIYLKFCSHKKKWGAANFGHKHLGAKLSNWNRMDDGLLLEDVEQKNWLQIIQYWNLR